jgi:hypothetical protein
MAVNLLVGYNINRRIFRDYRQAVVDPRQLIDVFKSSRSPFDMMEGG